MAAAVDGWEFLDEANDSVVDDTPHRMAELRAILKPETPVRRLEILELFADTIGCKWSFNELADEARRCAPTPKAMAAWAHKCAKRKHDREWQRQFMD